MREPTYKTRQQEAILKYLKSQKHEHVTVSHIHEHFLGIGLSIGITTIYRHLEKLLAKGQVHKYIIDGGTGACFQYADPELCEKEHFHLKCEICGQLFHLDCEFVSKIHHHIEQAHGFDTNPYKTVFYGTCKNCCTK